MPSSHSWEPLQNKKHILPFHWEADRVIRVRKDERHDAKVAKLALDYDTDEYAELRQVLCRQEDNPQSSADGKDMMLIVGEMPQPAAHVLESPPPLGRRSNAYEDGEREQIWAHNPGSYVVAIARRSVSSAPSHKTLGQWVFFLPEMVPEHARQETTKNDRMVAVKKRILAKAKDIYANFRQSDASEMDISHTTEASDNTSMHTTPSHMNVMACILLAKHTSTMTKDPLYEKTMLAALRDIMELTTPHDELVDSNPSNLALDGLYIYLNLRQAIQVDDTTAHKALKDWKKVDYDNVFLKARGRSTEFHVNVTLDSISALGRGLRVVGGLMGDKVLHRHRIHYIIVCFAKRWERNPTVQEADLAELVYDVYTADMLLRSDTIHAPLVLPSDNPVDPNVTLLKELTVMHTNFLRVARVLQTEYICLAIKHQNVFGDSQSGGDHMLATMSANTGEALQDELTKAAQCFEVEAARGLCVSISEAQFMASMLGDYIKSIIGNESSQSHAQDGMDIDEPSGTASVAGTQHDEPSSEWEGFGESSSEWEGLD